ncbi:hypothetical protein M885DRAFT_532224 [Pelagophyceae sp. CCMP2097]|nr:hypothetical protein M885DRAFT_532224 [Pelagophyceae sp. CCMP2097]
MSLFAGAKKGTKSRCSRTRQPLPHEVNRLQKQQYGALNGIDREAAEAYAAKNKIRLDAQAVLDAAAAAAAVLTPLQVLRAALDATEVSLAAVAARSVAHTIRAEKLAPAGDAKADDAAKSAAASAAAHTQAAADVDQLRREYVAAEAADAELR